MDFTLMLPAEDYSEEERATDVPPPHSHCCRQCDTEWLCWQAPCDLREVDECPECEAPSPLI